jgi:gliding motility-associated-like protein
MKFPKFHIIFHCPKSSNRQIVQSPNRQIAKSPNRQIAKSSNLPILLLLLLLLLSPSLSAQREADNWIFGDDGAGLNFTSGVPEPIFVNGHSYFNGAVMSDSLGNILFSFSRNSVWNREGLIMMNGDDILPSTHGLSGRCRIAFPKPGSASQYYIFSISSHHFLDGMYYSVIDMELDGGLGAVTSEKNVRLTAADKAQDKIFVLKNSTGDGYWVITRLFGDDRYASFKVTANGVDPVPVYSPTGIFRELNSGSGPMRVSSDKKYLISCYAASPYPSQSNVEISRFNAGTGVVTFMYTIINQDIGFPSDNLTPADCEISPDSKQLYIHWINGSYEGNGLYQYDMTLIENDDYFKSSALRLLFNGDISHIQLSNDGKIYFHYFSDTLFQYYQDKYLGVIHKPWENGLNCDVDTFGVYLGGRDAGRTLPTILLDYLYRFEWKADNYCQGSAVHFIPHFLPTPDSIRWFFDEFAPGSISHELSPTYTFQNAGIHEVAVDIWYPTGRFEHTSREIEISPSPLPLLGPDTLICQGSSLTLNANCVADMYSWSTGQIGSTSISISDSGTYWVRATFIETGCTGSDTIHVGFYPPVLIDETSLVVAPASCGGATGFITGLAIQGLAPFTYRWEDLSEVYFGSEIDVFDLPAGQYILKINDANGCEMISDVYTIVDAGNLQVLDVGLTKPHCQRPDGEIVIHAFSPSGSTLQYSINDGADYSSDSIFTGLSAGTYVVRIRDINGCEGFYTDNPISMVDIPGPQVQPPVVTDETDYLGNGSIEITATASTPVIFYSIDSGATWQENDGNFYNLQAGIYNLQIKDENGCDTTFAVEIQNIILTYLHAVTGEGGHCLGNTAMVPVNVDNFNSVATFHLKLSYNADNLQCEGFTNVHPQLLDSLTGWVDQAAGVINLAWNSAIPVTFSQQEKGADLVFTTKNPGQGQLSWYTGATESYFANAGGNPIPAEFQTGEVEIYEPPRIILEQSKTVCEGQMFGIMGIATGNQPPFEYLWTYPDGHQDDSDPFFFAVTQADAGEYILVVTDHVGCSDQQIIQLIVSENPVATFHGTDTLEMHAGDVLDAGPGMVSYRWSPGDTTQSIVIQAEGTYSVEMESQAGCVGRDSIYVKLTSEVIPEFEIYVPNAFSPNGDGVNDVFMMKFDGLSIFDFRISIFDRWGGVVFSGDGVSVGWDGKMAGKDCPGGVYVYKIVFEADGVPGQQERTGVVMLVR